MKVEQQQAIFTPVVITLTSQVEVANFLGALIGYGTSNKYAEKNLKAIGLGEYYSGNVRKAARKLATEILNVNPGLAQADNLADIFHVYMESDKFRKGSGPSKAGAKVAGTEEDLSQGREETHFESDDDEHNDYVVESEEQYDDQPGW